jgi:hypothetical protein
MATSIVNAETCFNFTPRTGLASVPKITSGRGGRVAWLRGRRLLIADFMRCIVVLHL